MPNIRTCRNEKCEYNINGCYCDALEVEVDEFGSCETFDTKWEDNED